MLVKCVSLNLLFIAILSTGIYLMVIYNQKCIRIPAYITNFTYSHNDQIYQFDVSYYYFISNATYTDHYSTWASVDNPYLKYYFYWQIGTSQDVGVWTDTPNHSTFDGCPDPGPLYLGWGLACCIIGSVTTYLGMMIGIAMLLHDKGRNIMVLNLDA